MRKHLGDGRFGNLFNTLFCQNRRRLFDRTQLCVDYLDYFIQIEDRVTTLNRHLTIIKIRTDPLSSACGRRKKLHTSFWVDVALECWIEYPFLDHIYNGAGGAI